MDSIQFFQLFQEEFYFSNIVAFNQYWKNGQCFRYADPPRPNNGLIYIACEKAVFCPEKGETIIAKEGDVVLLPAQSRYAATFTIDNSASHASILVNFDLLDDRGNTLCLGESLQLLPGKGEWGETFTRLAYLYRSRIYPHMELQSSLCQFFIGLQNHTCREAVSPITPALEYINRHLSQELYVSDLARSVGMSETVFRRRFKQHTGKSPTAYILCAKVQKARELLYMQDMTLDEVSTLLGFCDTPYFCKVFKKQIGITPSEYRSQK